ncbi:hypothetical protein AB0K21_21755 [Streptosporangium sp. NPDC049248]|uniref:hypothetical protein n=1 Tax=Streptosporangium sp. NPDC049248 TaxID=3155651 RepID=UPI003426434F
MTPSQRNTATPPEAVVILRRRTERGLEGPLSFARCVEMLKTFTDKPFTDRTWANYEQGKSHIPDRELVLMALVVGALPEELQETGRADAAAILRQEIEQRRAPTLTGASRRTVERLERAIEQINTLAILNEDQRKELVALLLEKVDTTLDQHNRQVDIMRRGS